MIKHIVKAIICSLTLLVFAGCGGGGSSSNTPATNYYRTATFKINLGGDLNGKAIAGAGFTLTLPANVTPEVVDNSVAATVVTPSGTFVGGTLIPPLYLAATATAPATMQIALANPIITGVTTAGEVATITLQLTNGAAPVAADFALNNVAVKVIDIEGNPVAGMTASVAGVLLQ